MILVQRTSWHNANLALKNLKKANFLSLAKIATLQSLDKLTTLIGPAGFYQSKPKRLFDLATFIVNQGGINILIKKTKNKLRHQLLAIKGVGQETADTVLLYALDKPVFIIDEYTRRWTKNHNLTQKTDYLKLQHFFHTHLAPDPIVYQNLHALIIISQRGKEKSKMEII